MEPVNIRFGGGPADSVLHPLVAIAMAISIILMLVLPRKYVIVSLFLSIFLTPKGQQIVLLGLHFNVYRIMILAGLMRWIVSRRSAPLVDGFNFMDRTCAVLFVSYFATTCMLYMQQQATVKSAGDLLDNLGGYFLVRFLIRDREDIRRTIKVFVTIAVVNALCMLNEQRTGKDLFSLLGGISAGTVRGGKVRSQGSFEIFLTAGSFGATLVPLVIWLWSQARSKAASVVGVLSATIMAFTCYTSTTVVTEAAGIGALCLWPIRKSMRLLRWGIVAMLIGLHFVMNGPVWSIIEHIDFTGSSSSYHRYMLIDTFIRHFADWWLIGTKDNGSWGFNMWDASNQFVAWGFSGGLPAFALFVAVIAKGFARIGKARKLVQGNRDEEWFLWCLGAALFSHVVAFFGIGYFDQVLFAWFALLAFISVAVFEANKLSVQSGPVPEAAVQPIGWRVQEAHQ